MKTSHLSTALLVSFVCLASPVRAQETFESAPSGLLTTFAGMSWSNFIAYDNVAEGYCTPSFAADYGYCAGVVSGNKAVFSGSGGDASFTSASPFSFSGGWFSAAFTSDPGLSSDPRSNAASGIAISGFLGATQLYSTTFGIAFKNPQQLSVNWTGIDRVTFSSLPNSGPSAQFVLDDLNAGDAVVATPEPATVTLIATGLLGVAVIRRRRRTA